LLLCLGVLVVHATRNRVRVWRDIPWRAPLIGLLGFQLLSVLWCTDVIEAVEEVVGTVIVLCTTLVLVSFIRSARDLRVVLWVWAATSMGIVVLTTLGVFAVEESAFEMAQSSKSGGLGQHPNWFAMNLMFIIHCCLALVLIERQAVVKWLWFVIGTGVFVGQMQSGSRGGTASVLLGGGLAALFHPRVRKIGLIASLPVGVMVVWVILSGSSSSGAFARVWSEGSSVLGASVRESNWLVCWQMFVDTSGLGIGAGGYEAMMGQYDWWLSNSQYTYPHGIFWGLLAHYGVVGVALYVWFLFRLIRMMLQSLKATQGTELQVMAWAMIATMVGYWAWSFFEFKLTDKPFWEFLALFTVFWGLTRNMAGSAKNPKKAT